jgi:uncharacterized protein
MKKLESERAFELLACTPAWLSGLVTGVVVGPDSVANQTWTDIALEGASDEATQFVGELTAVMLSFQESVARALETNVASIPPTYGEDAKQFALGFLRGAKLHPSWARDEIAVTWLIPFMIVSGLFAEEDLHDPDGNPITDRAGFASGHAARFGEHLTEIRNHWAARRASGRAARVGRNDPCPCGSGKKFKKCCAASS